MAFGSSPRFRLVDTTKPASENILGWLLSFALLDSYLSLEVLSKALVLFCNLQVLLDPISNHRVPPVPDLGKLWMITEVFLSNVPNPKDTSMKSILNRSNNKEPQS